MACHQSSCKHFDALSLFNSEASIHFSFSMSTDFFISGCTIPHSLPTTSFGMDSVLNSNKLMSWVLS